MRKKSGYVCPKCKRFTESTTKDKVMENVKNLLCIFGIVFIIVLLSMFLNTWLFDVMSNFAMSAAISTKFDGSDSMKALTYETTAPCYTNDYCNIRQIYNFVVNNQTYSQTGWINSASSTLKIGYSDCKNQAIIVANMLALKGIPYRFVISPDHIYAMGFVRGLGWVRADTSMRIFGVEGGEENATQG